MAAIRGFFLTSLVLGLVGCSMSGGSSRDGPPSDGASPAYGSEVVPRAEPKSRSGNPRSYVVFGQRYHVLDSANGFVERGVASWYGQKFHGRRTSSGETYNMHGMTAAHKSLPLPTFVEVTNLKNGRKLVLRVNDRGPFHDNRVIDLSYAAARKLDIVRTGTGLVEVRAITFERTANRRSSPKHTVATRPTPPKRPSPMQTVTRRPTPLAAKQTPALTSAAPQTLQPGLEASSGVVNEPQLFLQVGSFQERANAQRLRIRLMSLQRSAVNVSQVIVNGQSMHRVRIGPLSDVVGADRVSQQIVAAGMALPRIVIE